MALIEEIVENIGLDGTGEDLIITITDLIITGEDLIITGEDLT